MKTINRTIAICTIVLSLVITSCSSGGSTKSTNQSADETCVEGICAELTIAQPIALSLPATVIVKVRSTGDYPGLLITLQASPTDVVFGTPSTWNYDAVANQSQEFRSTVTFSSESEYEIAVVIFVKNGGPLLVNQERVLITSTEAVINPTINPNPTSDLFVPSTPLPQALTATAEAESTFTPFPPVEGFTPQEWLQKCGWRVDQPNKLTIWEGVSGWLNISETTAIDSQVDGTLSIGFKDAEKSDSTINTQIGLCTLGQGWTTEGNHEWIADLHSGTPFETPVTLSFTETGDISVFIVALDMKNNRIAGIGRLIYVKSKDQSFSLPDEKISKKGLESGTISANALSSPQWHLIESEDFFSASWPTGSTKWLVNDTTMETPIDLDRRWGTRSGEYSAWPAAGGAAGLASGNYPNNYSSEMILGPIETRGATGAEVDFSMLLDTESNYDFLELYASNNGFGWYQKARWSGYQQWSSYTVDLSGFVGSSSSELYLRWVFKSDSTVSKAGVWIDDISVWVLPGTVSISGTVSYTDRDNVSGQAASYIHVQLWDQNGGDWDFLEEKGADANGFFAFDARENWDEDSGDPDHRLDLYLLYETVYQKFQTNEQRVTRLDDSLYQWPIDPVQGVYTRWNITNGNHTINKALPPNPDNRSKAIWLFEDLMRAYKTVPGDAGSGRVHWEWGSNCITIDLIVTTKTICDNAFFLPVAYPDGVFIPDIPIAANAPDQVVHEIAHEYMANSNGFWYPFPGGWNTYEQCVLQPHFFFDSKTTVCAYTEGWAYFVAVAINRSLSVNDDCINWNNNHCGPGSQNLEDPNREDGQDEGDIVEGRVNCSLWDLYDSTNEDYDRATVDWSSIWDVQRATGGFTFRNFWNTWVVQSQNNLALNRHEAVQSIYQNFIDYDNPPTSNTIGNVIVLQGLSRGNAVDLWGGAFSDQESTVSEMTYLIVNTSPFCGAMIDSNHYVDIDLHSFPTYTGLCRVTIRANDGIKSVENSFLMDIRQIAGRSHLPIVISSPEGGNEVLGAETSGDLPTTGSDLLTIGDAYPAPVETSNNDLENQSQLPVDNNPYPAPVP